jgi:hypothetical protein
MPLLIFADRIHSFLYIYLYYHPIFVIQKQVFDRMRFVKKTKWYFI